MEPGQRLTGKVAIVSGGASGIGSETARTFGTHGAAVVVGDVNATAGEAVAASQAAVVCCSKGTPHPGIWVVPTKAAQWTKISRLPRPLMVSRMARRVDSSSRRSQGTAIALPPPERADIPLLQVSGSTSAAPSSSQRST